MTTRPPVGGDPKKNAVAIVGLCGRNLKDRGFSIRKGKTLLRRTNLKYDILKFDVIPRGRALKWQVPEGSFQLETGCLFSFLPALGSSSVDEPVQPEKVFGQVRLSIDRGIRQPQIRQPNIWWASADMETFNLVVEDVLGRILDYAIPFFSRFEDAGELLRTLIEDEDAHGSEGVVWELGNKGSVRRLLYTGFAAIACEKWDLAVASLNACQEEILQIPAVIRANVSAQISPYIEQGMSAAKHKRSWTFVEAK